MFSKKVGHLAKQTALVFICSLIAVQGAHKAAAASTSSPWSNLTYEIGDSFIYDNGRVETFRAKSEDGLTWATRQGSEYLRPASFFLPLSAWQTNRQIGTVRIKGNTDIEVKSNFGSRFTAIRDIIDKETNKSRRSLQYWVCHALPETSIQVPAGEFETIPIQCDRYSPGSMKTLIRRTWYFSSDVGHYVQRDSISFLNGERSTIKLLASLPGAYANRARFDAILRNDKE